jgi:hypothetical protein
MPLTMSDGNQLCYTPDQCIPRVDIFYCRENVWLSAINLHCDGSALLLIEMELFRGSDAVGAK